ncbi:MAG: fumarylacetoacetate hydrolase family protein [Alistipes sp.]|nr:fumarylacetoacetate hydrolase family protein [Alistipes sp.]
MKIICMARNYPQHAAEMSGTGVVADSGSNAVPPAFFIKPDTALLRNNDPFYIPDFSQQVDYECEMVVRIDRMGKSISRRFARRYYNEVGLGIDFTARDIQRMSAAAGMPWTTAKCFDRSAAVSPVFIPLADVGGNADDLHFELCVDGEVRQRGSTADMIYGVDEIIEYVSRFMTLRTGDLIFTGTPAGVGPVRRGNNLKATLEGRLLFDFDIK